MRVGRLTKNTWFCKSSLDSVLENKCFAFFVLLLFSLSLSVSSCHFVLSMYSFLGPTCDPRIKAVAVCVCVCVFYSIINQALTRDAIHSSFALCVRQEEKKRKRKRERQRENRGTNFHRK